MVKQAKGKQIFNKTALYCYKVPPHLTLNDYGLGMQDHDKV